MSEFQHTYEGGETQCTHCRGWTRGANLRTECPTRLRVEVERLRAHNIELQTLGVSLHKAAAAGRDAERAAVVAWLQRMAGNARHWGGDDNIRAEIYDNLVDVFECGEHRSEEKD